MNSLLKANLLALYALALLSLWITMPWGSGPVLQRLALIVVGIHAVETVAAFKYLRTYPGPLWRSIAESMLYGLLHWWPLAKAYKRHP